MDRKQSVEFQATATVPRRMRVTLPDIRFLPNQEALIEGATGTEIFSQ